MKIDLAKNLDQIAQDSVFDNAKATCRRIRCSEHRESPTVQKTRKGFEIHGCCDAVVKRAKEAIGAV